MRRVSAHVSKVSTHIRKPRKARFPKVHEKKLGSHHKQILGKDWATKDAEAFTKLEMRILSPDKLKRSRRPKQYKFMEPRHPRRKLL